MMSEFIETQPIEETKLKPVGIVYGSRKLCANCITVSNFGFNSRPVFSVRPCIEHR